MKDWKVSPEFKVRGTKSLLEPAVPLRIEAGDGKKPECFTVDVYPRHRPQYPSRHFGTWQFPFDAVRGCRRAILKVETDGVTLTCDGEECTPSKTITGGLREDGAYVVYLVLAEVGTFRKIFEISIHRLLSFSGDSLDPVEHWPDPFRRDLRTIQPEYWMMKKLYEAVEGFASTLSAGSSVLDYGGGEAPYYPLFGARGLKYTNAEVADGQFVDMAIEEGYRLPVEDEAFDAVVCTHVLEHVLEPEKNVSEIFRVLKKGGRLLAAMPFAWENHNTPCDYRRFGRDGVGKLLERFRDVEITADSNTAQALLMLKAMHHYNSVKNSFLRNTLIRWDNFRFKHFASRCRSESLTCNFIVTAVK